jgi:hypothetical protein
VRRALMAALAGHLRCPTCAATGRRVPERHR